MKSIVITLNLSHSITIKQIDKNIVNYYYYDIYYYEHYLLH